MLPLVLCNIHPVQRLETPTLVWWHMITLSIFFGFINLVSCTSENERKPFGSDTCNIFNNYSNLGHETSPASCQNGGGLNLFGSRLNHNNRFAKPSGFIPHGQDAKSNQFINHSVHSGYMIPTLTTFGEISFKPQELPLQIPISSYYLASGNQPFAMDRIGSNPAFIQGGLPCSPYFIPNFGITSNKLESNGAKKTLKPDQNALTTNPSQPERALLGFTKSIHEIDMDLGDHKINNGELNQSFTKRKSQRKPWKAYELNNLLKGVNEYYTDWKEILNSYEFEKGRTNANLCSKFHHLETSGKIVHTKEFGWKFVNRGKLTDLVRAEEENEQMQSKKGFQEETNLVNNKSEHELDNPEQDKVSGVIENSNQEQDQKGSFFAKANKKKRQISWENHEFINLIKGINMYGTSWKKILELFEFKQGRTSTHLQSQFFALKKHGKVTFTEDLGWSFVNASDSSHSGENKASKATGNQRQKRPFFVERAKNRSGRQVQWKKRELDDLLKGVNKYGRSWKRIFDFYEFEGRTSIQLASQFMGMEKKGQIIYEKDFGWKYTDLYGEKLNNKVIFEKI